MGNDQEQWKVDDCLNSVRHILFCFMERPASKSHLKMWLSSNANTK